MTIEINLEQVSYLKSLDSKKKQRKFLLDCLVGIIIGESVKFDPDDLVGMQKLKQYEISPEKRAEYNRKLAEMREEHDKKMEEINKSFYDKLKDIFYCKSSKISDLPKTKINDEVTVYHTTTTAPRTFMLSGNHFQDSIDLAVV